MNRTSRSLSILLRPFTIFRAPFQWRAVAVAAVAAALASCAGPGGGGSVRRDAWGHRPGPQGFRTVMLDAGHGGKDAGARSRFTGQMEKDAALDVVRRVERQLGGTFRVVLTRSNDRFIELDDRVAMASRSADVLVSVHFNSGPSVLAGAETYFWRVDSHGLAVRLHSALGNVAAGKNNRGLVRRRLRLTRNPQIPCVLVECGYLSNGREAPLIASPAHRERLATAIASALRTQAARGDAGTGPLPRPLNEPLSTGSDPRQ